MPRYIDADALIENVYDEKKHNHLMAPFKLCTADRVDLKFLLNDAPTVDAVPTYFHDKCMQAEIHKRIELEKIARLLCEGYLDMPCGCDGCPLVDTTVEDDEGNGVCELWRADNG